MEVKVGTFNLNNLFSRYNFKAEITSSTENKVTGEITYTFEPSSSYTLRTYQGKLIKKKEEKELKRIAERIIEMNLDVLAVQEVEDIDTLHYFNKNNLNDMYQYEVLHEGNDRRLIDVGLLSKYPVGAIISWQQRVHPDRPDERVFSRDLLQVEILDEMRSKTLFTLFNNHLKSQFINYWEKNKEEIKKEGDEKRRRQIETITTIIKERMKEDDPYIVLGDMNAGLDSDSLKPLIEDLSLKLVNALEAPKETVSLNIRKDSPVTTAWTHRFKEKGKPAKYELYDQIWLSNELASKQTEAWIGRRRTLTKDGSDHDPAWIVLTL
jgi:endonuclease/exonuclease/phosphatase family metal-dependent hydrolase